MPEHRNAARGLVCVAALALALITAPPVLAHASLPGPGASWEPGVLLVKLRPGITPRRRQRLLHRLGLRQVDQLPLVPDLFEVRLPPGTHVMAAERKLNRQPDVLYAQPNYEETETPEAGPADLSYWPTDHLFRPTTFTPPPGCLEPGLAGQWPLWQLGHNLTDSSDPANQLFGFSGTPLVDGGLVQYRQYNSINVLPVWNLLIDRNRLPAPNIQISDQPQPKWRYTDIEHYGIAVQDTGLSDEPDIKRQIAALFSTVTSRATRKDSVIEVYRDDFQRNDLATVRDAFTKSDPPMKIKREFDFGFTDRPLFALDDTNIEAPRTGNYPKMPTGCDGHGTAVASVADATAYNGTGIAGVAYNAPLIGLRPGEPWDLPDDTSRSLANDGRANDALQAAELWWSQQAKFDTTNAIEELEIVKALKVPVLNMSFGRPLFGPPGRTLGKPTTPPPPPTVDDPALIDALLRTLATGNTLGVAAAGNGVQQYGSLLLRTPAGTETQSPVAPCGLGLLRNSGAVDPNGQKFSDTVFPGPKGDGGDRKKVNLDWSTVNLLCVAATTSDSSRLATFSGQGDAAVDIAAPGEGITALARPVIRDSVAQSAFWVTDGTSVAAPMVAGAASLLREAAPGAPIADIAKALRQGARMNPFLEGSVRYGSLDIACALKALGKLKDKAGKDGKNWELVSLDDPNFKQATQDCGGTGRYVEETTRTVSTRDLREGPTFTLTALIKAKGLTDGPTSTSRGWQQILLGEPFPDRIAFDEQGKAVKPADADRLPVYDAGTATVGCDRMGFAIVKLSVVVDGQARLWYFPTDEQTQQNRIEVALAAGARTVGGQKSLTIQVQAYCDKFPSITG